MLIPVVSIARQDEPLLKVGVLSDVHLGHYNPKADSIFVRSLEYFKSYDVDAVIIAGDFLTDGTEDQMKKQQTCGSLSFLMTRAGRVSM